jgi:hypothetical protein
MKSNWLPKLVAAACVVILAACSSKPKVEEKEVVLPLNTLMEQASATEKAGQKDAALRQYADAAKLYPTAKQPWLRIAQINFDAGSYGEAIVAAQQVTARDDRDKVAHSILSVGGLRVSTKALSDLSRQNDLTGSVRSEAQDLAKVLRESLGERVLVPAPAAAPISVPAPAAVAPRPAPRAVAAPRPAAPVPAPAPAAGGGGSPFGILK